MSVIDEAPRLIGESPVFLAMMEAVSRLAALDRPALVIGERGTGKELIAGRLHYLSPRWQRPFVTVNCAALAESVLESELFGHEAGAFTGAQRQRIGRFELADGGTLFLDEIANASAVVQEKILRAIEYGVFERPGGNRSLRVDVRVVCATNLDLPAEAEAGRFRRDLLDRLAFDVITVPPLRARGEDIALLAEHFRAAMARELGWGAGPRLGAEALAALAAHPWPGNVRELKNAVERAVYRAEPDGTIDEIVFDPFASPYRPRPALASETVEARRESGEATLPLDLDATVAGFERRLIEAALERHRHNRRAAARSLGLSYDQLRARLRRHGLSRPPPAPDAGRS